MLCGVRTHHHSTHQWKQNHQTNHHRFHRRNIGSCLSLPVSAPTPRRTPLPRSYRRWFSIGRRVVGSMFAWRVWRRISPVTAAASASARQSQESPHARWLCSDDETRFALCDSPLLACVAREPQAVLSVPRELLTPRFSCHCGVRVLRRASGTVATLPCMSGRLQHHDGRDGYADSSGRRHDDYSGGGIAHILGPLPQRSREASAQMESHMSPTPPNHALQRTRPSRRGCKRTPSRAGSLSLGR